jgi:hypothetical protein
MRRLVEISDERKEASPEASREVSLVGPGKIGSAVQGLVRDAEQLSQKDLIDRVNSARDALRHFIPHYEYVQEDRRLDICWADKRKLAYHIGAEGKLTIFTDAGSQGCQLIGFTIRHVSLQDLLNSCVAPQNGSVALSELFIAAVKQAGEELLEPQRELIASMDRLLRGEFDKARVNLDQPRHGDYHAGALFAST